MEGPISDLTRNKFKLLSGTEQTSSKALTVPFPEKGTIYDYQFIPEVSSEAGCVTACLVVSAETEHVVALVICFSRLT